MWGGAGPVVLAAGRMVPIVLKTYSISILIDIAVKSIHTFYVFLLLFMHLILFLYIIPLFYISFPFIQLGPRLWSGGSDGFADSTKSCLIDIA